MARVDLHCHSIYSDYPAYWIMRRFGSGESYTEPEDLYWTQKRRGMDFVTVTDHDRIEGAVELAEKYDDAFISTEISTGFPEDGVKVHILALGITEEQFREIRLVQPDIYELQQLLREQNIVHVAAHPVFDMTGVMKPDHIEKLILMFENIEVHNGALVKQANMQIREILNTLTPQLIEQWSKKHKIEPVGKQPWLKAFTGGSDDHSGYKLAKAWTRVNGAKTWQEFLQGIVNRESDGEGQHEDALAFAHGAHSILAKWYHRKFLSDTPVEHRPVKMIERVFGPVAMESGFPALYRVGLSHKSDSWNPSPEVKGDDTDLWSFVKLLTQDWNNDDLLLDRQPSRKLQDETFAFASSMFNRMIKSSGENFMEHMRNGRVVQALEALAPLMPALMSLYPYWSGFSHVYRNVNFRRSVSSHFSLSATVNLPPNWGWFTDTLLDVNGVARTIQTISRMAKQFDTPINVITSSPTVPNFEGDMTNFKPVFNFKLPEYEMMSLSLPPFLDVLGHCERRQFTRLIISTPGPVGVAALMVARVLSLPTAGIYHTDLPNYVKILTGDKSLLKLTWSYVKWFYGQLDTVYVLSEYYRDMLREHGLKHPDIRIFPKGIKLEDFSPEFRTNEIWEDYELNGKTKILYVGRISKEKDLDVLRDAYRMVKKSNPNITLILVGDGPYQEELQEQFKDEDVVFTGFLEGEVLSRAFASSDIFAFPSTTDTYGTVLLEAQASGLPTIVSDIGGPKEVIIDGETGIVTRGKDAKDFARGLAKLVEDDKLRKKMGQAGYKHVQSKSWESAFWRFWNDMPDTQN